MGKLRISYVDPRTVTDPEMIVEFERARREGTPRPESQAMRAHVPAVFWSFANTWRDVFRGGVVDHPIKELCRVYVSKSVNCKYCGGQRSVVAAQRGLTEDDHEHLLDFEHSDRYDDRQKAALALARAITWDEETDDGFWERLSRHFSEPQIVELGYFIGITMGQQRFNRLLNMDEHPVPGFEFNGESAGEARARINVR